MSDEAQKRPLVGIGVIVLKGDCLLLGKRKGGHGDGEWALPGGHLEHAESFESCAMRETYEETGLRIVDIEFYWAANSVFPCTGSHYVTIFMRAALMDAGQEPELREPQKCSGWEWCPLDDLPSPRFLPLQMLLDSGFDPRANPSLTVEVAEPVSQQHHHSHSHSSIY